MNLLDLCEEEKCKVALFIADMMLKSVEEQDLDYDYAKDPIFVINIDENCIIVDCNNRDWIYSLIVISTDYFADSVSEIMMRWDNEIREEYGQELVLCEQDVFGKSATLLESIEEYYKQKIYKSFY